MVVLVNQLMIGEKKIIECFYDLLTIKLLL